MAHDNCVQSRDRNVIVVKGLLLVIQNQNCNLKLYSCTIEACESSNVLSSAFLIGIAFERYDPLLS